MTAGRKDRRFEAMLRIIVNTIIDSRVGGWNFAIRGVPIKLDLLRLYYQFFLLFVKRGVSVPTIARSNFNSGVEASAEFCKTFTG